MASPSEENSHHIVNIPDGTVEADDKIIVPLGPTGVGKSNFIERLADNDLRISSSGTRRGTNDLQVYRLMDHPIWNSRVVLVDTPGFKDAELSEYGTLKIIKGWLETCKAAQLHAMFYFDRITYNLKRGDKECYNLFMRLCGKDGAARACLVTTTWDEVRMRDGLSAAAAAANRSLLAAEVKRRQLEAHWKSYLGKGLQFCEFQNTATSAMEILMGSLKCDDYSKRFVLENPNINLIKPPLEDLVFKLLTEKYDATVDTLKGFEEDINLLREQGQETELFVKRLEALRVVVKHLEEELLEFKKGRRALDKRNKDQRESTIDPRPSSPQDAGQRRQREPVTINLEGETLSNPVIIKSEDIQMDDIVIICLSPTGIGKTTFIQSVVGTEVIGLNVGHSLCAGTTAVTCVKVAIPGTHSSLVLVDTPGFDDPDKTDAEVLEIIAKWLESTYRRRILLTGLIYFQRITDIRQDHGIQNALNVFQHLSGLNAFERVTLVTTMWNDLRDEQIGVEREEHLMNDDLWRPMITRKAMTGRYDSRNRDTAVNIIKNMVDGNTKTVLLKLQEELVDRKMSLPSTSAGKVAFTDDEAMRWRVRRFMGFFRL